MGDDAIAFVRAFGLAQIDLLGFSIGGYVAQAFSLQEPNLVRRLMLLGTGPRGRERSQDANFLKYATSTDPATGEPGLDAFLYLFFAFAEKPGGRQSILGTSSSTQKRCRQAKFRADDEGSGRRDSKPGEVKGERFAALKKITQPTLVVNGNNDVMVPTINSYTLAQHMPDAQLIIYPDAGHGSQYQYFHVFSRARAPLPRWLSGRRFEKQRKKQRRRIMPQFKAFRAQVDAGVLTVTLDDPPLNLIGPTFAEDLIALIQEAEASQHIAW